MNELKDYKIRKNGDYTPNDVLEKAKEIVEKLEVKRMIVIIEDEEGNIRRYNTGMDIIEMHGLLEFTKALEFLE